MADTTKMGLHAAKLAVMEKVRRVEKTRRMQGSGNYQYVGLEEIIAELRPAMVTNGLTIIPMKSELVQSGVTKQGNRLIVLIGNENLFFKWNSRTEQKITADPSGGYCGQGGPI